MALFCFPQPHISGTAGRHIYCLPNDSALGYVECNGWEEGIRGEGMGAEQRDISNDSLEVSMNASSSQSDLTTLYPFRLLHAFIGVLSEVCSLHFEKEEF